MLLRRITKRVKDQNWFAVGIELVILVLGVFIGIQMANWNEARVGREQLDQQLVSLRFELQENLLHFAAYRAELVQQMDDVSYLRSAFESDPSSITAEEFHSRFLNIQRIKLFSPDLTALSEIAETGGLRQLSGTDIRRAIVDWERELANVHRGYADALTQRDTVLNPYMMQSVSYGALLEQSYILEDKIADSNFQSDIAALAGSREFDNHLAYRYGISGSTVYALDGLSRTTDRLIELLRKSEGQP